MAKISDGMQGLMNDFLEAKRSFYGWDEDTFNRKADNFKKNIKKVTFKPNARGGNVKGVYMPTKSKLVLGMDGDSISSQETNIVVHELNHAFNHEPGKRINLLKTKGNRIPQNMKKYKMLTEIINEAETQVIAENSGRTDGKFGLYIEGQPAFEMLCVSCNQDAATFLRGIEGKDIDGLTSYVAEHSGHSLTDTEKYINAVAEELNRFKEKPLQDFHQSVDKEQPGYRTMVSINEQFIESSKLDDSSKTIMKDLITGIKENEFYSLKEMEARRAELRTRNSVPSQMQQAAYVRAGRKFDWGVPETATKMSRTYTGLDAKGKLGLKQQLALPNANNVLTSQKEQANVNQQNSLGTVYKVPPAPTMMQCMPDLANINTPEETIKSYAAIDARIAAAPTINTPTISGPSIGGGGSAGGAMVR